MNTDPRLTIDGSQARLVFRNFDIDAYRLFLKAKALPEKSVAFDWRQDTYTLTTHRRYASRLGAPAQACERPMLPPKPFLFDYQQFVVRTAVEAQRYCVFLDTGLGKTFIELELARQVLHAAGGKVLLMTFLQIIPQMIEEARTWYPELDILRIDSREQLLSWLTDGGECVAIVNYEKMIPGVIPEFRNLSGLILDEGSVLKTGGGKIKWNTIKSAKGIPYKFSLSATPAPNDIAEYASQASFLEKMQGFWDYFCKRGEQKGDWEVKPHAREAFYRYMASWSIYMRSPKRFGFADNLASLPAPVFHDVPIAATPEQHDFAMGVFAASGSGMFGDSALGVVPRSKLSQAAKGFVYDKSAPDGVRHIPSRKPDAVADIIAQCLAEGRQVLVWTVFDEESRLVAQACDRAGITAYATLHGDLSDSARLDTLERFRRGEARALVSKAQLLGFGMNFQFCTAMVFSGWDDSYERYYQAVRRAYRYGQTQPVHIYTPIVTELEGPIQENLMRKKANFERDAEAQEQAFIEAFREVLSSHAA